MTEIPFDGGPAVLIGALDVDRTPDGVVPRRLPDWTRHQLVDPALAMLVTTPAGVRLAFTTDATEIELDVLLLMFEMGDEPVMAPCFDLVVDGELVDGQATTEGTVLHLDPATGGFEFRPGGPTTVRFQGLPGRAGTDVEVWLPQIAVVELRALRASEGATIGPPATSTRPTWIHYGSSISHCLEAERPTGTWPAVAARASGVDLQNLAFAGQCMLDQAVARTIRDLAADVISLKVGINVINGDTMRERTLVMALHGFLDTVRDGHPSTPIAVITPIICPPAEDHPGPTISSPGERRVHIVPRAPELSVGALTLTRVRTLIAEVVEARRAHGDANLHVLDGLALFGAGDVADLPDDLHPNAAGYQRMGERFAAMAFAAGGVFGATRR
jgi:lysophospholipase L1-like esterase